MTTALEGINHALAILNDVVGSSKVDEVVVALRHAKAELLKPNAPRGTIDGPFALSQNLKDVLQHAKQPTRKRRRRSKAELAKAASDKAALPKAASDKVDGDKPASEPNKPAAKRVRNRPGRKPGSKPGRKPGNASKKVPNGTPVVDANS